MADVVVNTETKNSTELLGQGIRAYVLQDYNSAVTALSKASELMAAELGNDLHDSLGEVYLYYGKSLLGLSREENEALGDAVPKGQEESDDEEEEGEDDEDDKQNEQNGEKENSIENKVEDQDLKEDKGQEKTTTTEGQSTSNGTGEATSNGTPGTGEDKENDDDDEPTDLQVAWEVLELAKQIFERQGDAGKKNLADTLVVLGEIALESENFPSAITDISQGVTIQKTLFGKESRVVAESCFKLGVAYSTNSQMDEAIASFTDSLEYLRTRVEHLENMEDKKDEINDEIKEIKNLIPEVEEKIADIKSYKDEALKKILATVTEQKKSCEGSSSEAGTSKPANDISHLVKKKRKLDQVGGKDDIETNATKKPAV